MHFPLQVTLSNVKSGIKTHDLLLVKRLHVCRANVSPTINWVLIYRLDIADSTLA